MATETKLSEPGDAGANLVLGERPQTMREAFNGYVQRVRGGDMGLLPAVFGLLVLVMIFYALEPETFLSEQNVANLFRQAAAISILAMGLVFVLLLGEIDLSAGVAGGVCTAVMAKLLDEQGVVWWVALLAALVTGLLIGFFTGSLVALVGIPSFVVTLALFIAWQGVSLRLIGEGGTIPVNDEVIEGIANNNISPGWGWALCAAAVLGYAAVVLISRQRRADKGVSHNALSVELLKIAVVAVILVAGTYYMNLDRAPLPAVVLAGIPYAVPLVAALLILWTFVLGRTGYGRHVYAVGGNAEAARRAGIQVSRIRISVFVICSTMAAVSGIVDGSRIGSVTPGSGGGNTLLYAVGAAVIGGTSLFGGKGKAISAVIGALVIATIANGLSLLGQAAYINFLVTGGVLLVAASVDALSRRRARTTGHI